MSKERKLTVTIRLVTFIGGENGRGMRVYVEDKESHCAVLDADIVGDEHIANLFMGRDCEGVADICLQDQKLWGLRMENKDVTVPCDDGYADETASAACDKAERSNPGWAADDYCRKYNHHKRRNGGYTVTMRRWVRPDKEQTR